MIFKTLSILVVTLFFVSCGDNKNITSTEDGSYSYLATDIDYDGLADKYEASFGLVVGVKDASLSYLDPLFTHQWHLKNSFVQYEDINVEPVWRETIGEKNITVAIVDTGVDANHTDLLVDLNNSFRYSDNSNDPSPTPSQLYLNSSSNAHGTACAGIVASKGWNKYGVRGISPNINLVGLNVFSSATDANFASALLREGVDVSSNSWGGGGANFLYDDRTSLEAIETGVKMLRRTKGVVYVFASGNDSANANFQSILTSGYVISVSAVDEKGEFEEYSDYGSNILVSAPGGAADFNIDPAIVTTDLAGLKYGMDVYRDHWTIYGNEEGDYTNTMNGTSAACPIISGVVALMLSVNQNLTYRDIQYIIATTARKNDKYNLSWKKSNAGYFVSDKYGFGVVDASRAVNSAKNFVSLGKELSIKKSYDLNVSIDSGNELIFETQIDENFSVLNAQLTLYTNHNNNGKLKIVLESPSGKLSTLAYGDTVLYDKYEPWSFLSVQFLDESSKGKWVLHIQDMGSANKGELKYWSLLLKGYKR